MPFYCVLRTFALPFVACSRTLPYRSAMLNQLTISQLVSRLAKRETSSREIMQACLDQVQRVDPKVHAFISFDAADALAQADAADTAMASGQTHAQRPLLGVPIA